MKIIVCFNKHNKQFQVDPDEEIENVKALCQVQFGIPIHDQTILFKNRECLNAQRLNKAGIGGLDKLILHQTSRIRPAPVVDPRTLFFRQEAQKFLQHFRYNPAKLEQLKHSNPRVYQAVRSNNLQLLTEQIKSRYEQSQRRKKQHQRQIALLSSGNQFDPQVQLKIEQLIKKKNIQENFNFAQECTPQSFQRVHMLYINAFINNFPVTAFIDSGAQNSNISKQLAQKCGILRLLDTRFHGTAVGVGSAKILGRIHSVPLYINGQYFPISLSVLDNLDIGFLFGLDMLKRHKCLIDLSQQKLIFTLLKVEVKFLTAEEIQQQVFKAKQNQVSEQKVKALMNDGFGRKQSVQALVASNDNLQMAKMMLLQMRQAF